MAADTTATTAGFSFQDGLIQEVREFMETQLVAEMFGADGTG
jgi:hypothetical protein